MYLLSYVLLRDNHQIQSEMTTSNPPISINIDLPTSDNDTDGDYYTLLYSSGWECEVWKEIHSMKIQWAKYLDRFWYLFLGNDLPDSDVEGVYVISYYKAKEFVTVRVGKGDIKDRLSKHRINPKILYYKKHGTLHVTWAAVANEHQEGVERFLGDTLKPLIACRFPDVPPIPVNLP